MNSDKEAEEVKCLGSALAKAPVTGFTVIQISELANLPPSRTRKRLERHPDYFVKIAGRVSFALDRFKPHKGQLRDIIESIDKDATDAKRRRRALYAMTALLAVYWFVVLK